MIEDKLTYQIIGCAIEFESAGINFGREVEQPIFYRGVEVGTTEEPILLSPIKSSLN